MAFIDYYKILGADRYDDSNKIREARNERLKQYNSDRGNIVMGEAEKQLRDTVMKEINAAWEKLGDEEKRKKYNEEVYDKRFATPPRGASPNPPPGRSYQQQYTPPNPPPFTPPPPPPGRSYQQQYTPPFTPPPPPPRTPPRGAYQQHYAPPMAPTAEAKQKRNNRIVVRGMGGGAIGGAGAFGTLTAILHPGVTSPEGVTLIIGAIILAIVGAIVGVIAGVIALVVIRILAGKGALAFYGRKNAAIATITGIVAGAVIPLPGMVAGVVGAEVVEGAIVAGIVCKKS